jgi:putative membrane protein
MSDDVGMNDGTAAAAQGPALEYVSAAGASDLYEIESSRMALEKTQNEGVRTFAQMMIDHHTGTTEDVTAAARTAGLTPPPPSLLPPQQQMMDELQPLTGEAFDEAYLDQQRQAHQSALSLHQNYAEGGDTAELREVASAAVPIIEQHIEQLQDL